MQENANKAAKVRKKSGMKKRKHSWRIRLVFPKQLFLLFTIVACSFLLLPDIKSPHNQLKLGAISPEDFKSPTELSIEDESTTTKRKAEAVESVLAVYDIDPRVVGELVKRVDDFFTLKAEFFQKLSEKKLEEFPENHTSNDSKHPNTSEKTERPSFELSDSSWEQFVAFVRVPISKKYFELLRYPIFDSYIMANVKSIIRESIEDGVVGSGKLLEKEKDKGITTLNIKSNIERNIEDVTSIMDIKDAKESIRRKIETRSSADVVTQDIESYLAGLFIQPNLTFNNAATEERKNLAKENIAPVYFQLKKGEMIIREGERVREEHLVKLRALEKLRKKSNILLVFFGLVLLVSFLTRLLCIYIKKSGCQVIGEEKCVILIELLLVFSLIISKYSITIGNALASYFNGINVLSFHYAVPFNVASIMIILLLDLNIAMLSTMILALFAGVLMGNLTFSVMTFISGAGSIFFLAESRKRTSVVLAGLIMGAVNSLIVVAMGMIKGDTISMEILNHVYACMLGGLFTVSLASVFLPIAESAFNVTTDIKLLELSNFNQPLLRRLAMEAPGTYYHSIILGNLAESACQAIDANYLFARVSSYYHDVGKVQKPEYFIENNNKADAKHAKLTPRMSKLILVSHVKEGAELAASYKLSPRIIDIIKQHHGTSLMRFFYQKAKDNEDPELECVNTEDYRYPGPKPQTKEAGVVMLADAVEAASRSLADPTPSRIRTLIQTIVNNIFKDGQLDECALTLKDLHMITQSFSRTLQSIFHSRIDYPDVDPNTQIKGKGLEADGSSDNEQNQGITRLKNGRKNNGQHFKVQKIRG